MNMNDCELNSTHLKSIKITVLYKRKLSVEAFEVIDVVVDIVIVIVIVVEDNVSIISKITVIVVIVDIVTVVDNNGSLLGRI